MPPFDTFLSAIWPSGDCIFVDRDKKDGQYHFWIRRPGWRSPYWGTDFDYGRIIDIYVSWHSKFSAAGDVPALTIY